MTDVHQQQGREQNEKSLEYAVDTRKLEIGLFWTRSLFFWGFIGAAFVAFGVSMEKDEETAFLIACFGLICSLAWTLINRANRYWRDEWDGKVESVQHAVLGRDLFSLRGTIRDPGWLGPKRYSTTKLAIILSDFTILVWLALLVRASPPMIGTKWSYLQMIAMAVTAVYVGLIGL